MPLSLKRTEYCLILMQPETTMLSKISQIKQKNKQYHMASLICDRLHNNIIYVSEIEHLETCYCLQLLSAEYFA